MKTLKMKLVSLLFASFAAMAISALPAHADVRTTTVLAGNTDSYNATFFGGQLAQVTVRGDGDTVLGLFVYDQNGNLIGSTTCASKLCQVSWVPRWTGPFQIRVVNYGGLYNNYTLWTV
jgi:hypothetical protein